MNIKTQLVSLGVSRYLKEKLVTLVMLKSRNCFIVKKLGQLIAGKLAVLLMVYCVVGCSSPSPPELPGKEIVFQRYPIVDYEDSTILGFINADGSGFEEHELIEKSGGMPTWSIDGQKVFYHWWPPSIRDCSPCGGSSAVAGLHVCSKTLLHSRGRPHPVPGQEDTVLVILVEDTYKDTIFKVAMANPLTCEVDEDNVLYHSHMMLYDVALSPDGLLALTFWDVRDLNTGEEVVVVNLDTGQAAMKNTVFSH